MNTINAMNKEIILGRQGENLVTWVTKYCYSAMFYGCTSLTQAPALPATTLGSYCYRFMFEFTAITAIPRIMATTYATDSCKGMFDDIKHSMSTVDLGLVMNMGGLHLHLPIVL